MNEDQVNLLFGLFAGEDVVPEDYPELVEMAIEEVEEALLPDADVTDGKLCFLAGAVAALRYTQITAARDQTACTYAGGIAQNTDAVQKLKFAYELVEAYRRLCRHLLRDDAFAFRAV